MLEKLIDWLNFGQGKQGKKAGLILWKGKSLIDGQRIMVIATGVFGKSTNRKTGEMIQTYIMKRDMDLARKILLFLEANEDMRPKRNLPIEGYDSMLVQYHVNLLYEAG
ncbi:DUF2513 domain-containing protein, partial [Patescibacteria group bacterium]|nr:DUF2513 domain-containing protein [Patescibacteria group bacterium]